MKEDMKRIEDKIDKLDERLDGVDKQLVVYNAELVKHIEGTIQNRQAINFLKDELTPIKDHVHSLKTISWTISMLCIVIFSLYQSNLLQKIVRLLFLQ